VSQPPTRKLRTWSRFGQTRLVPSEYEIVTHDANYTTRKERTSALESNPSSPVNMWYLTYRDRSPLSAEDWHGFRDPDELTYRNYVTIQDEQETVVEGILDAFDKVSHDAALSPRWLRVLSTVFTPMRYPAHAFQMMHAYLGQIAPSSYITNCAAFAAADQLRLVSLVAYRTRQLQIAHHDAGFATGERQIWEAHPDWQPTRRALETALIAYDWGECLAAVNLVLYPTLSEILLRQLGSVADRNRDQLAWLILSHLSIDAERNSRWSAALARYAVAKRPENAAVLRRWVQRWAPRADDAAAGLAHLLAELPEAGQDAETTLAAAKAARERVLSDAGLLTATE
jgi:toluene monooxygenase system protein E